MVKHLSEEKLIECRKYFWKQDRDRNGKLSWVEFNKMCGHIGLHLSEQQLDKAFNSVDKDKNGQITFAEFIAAYCSDEDEWQNFEPVTPEKIKEARDYFDYKKLSRVEFIRMTSQTKIVMTNEELKRAFDIADADKDGKISFEQFESIFKPDFDEPSGSSVHRQKSLEEITGLCKYFWHSDKNSDGKLSLSEFLQMLDILGMKLSHRERTMAFSIADDDGDGMISFMEFADAYLNTDRSRLTTKQLKDLFYKADKDRNGVLSRDECLDALKMLGHAAGERRMEKIISCMDRDSNKTISLDEFCAFLDLSD